MNCLIGGSPFDFANCLMLAIGLNGVNGVMDLMESWI